ncbi:MAG: hypothetical protein ISS25_00095 [Nanoarchaeota archaeon]|nr:hypothetical protein [DPANN group archaeon]MBL7116219.1 hypothetical protein [Nanoarchaeota archaeon]
MKNKNFGIVALVLVAMLLLAWSALAHGGFSFQGTFHEQMEEIMEEGTYDDLLAMREELGFNMMPWVVDEETFEQAKEHHEAMEEFHERNGYSRYGLGMMGYGRFGYGMGRGFGCSMMS